MQIQPTNHVLDHADYTAPTRQHELPGTSYRSGIYLSALKDLDHQVEIDDLADA